jgi:hypothetical protein
MYPERLTIAPTRRSPWIVFEQGRIFVMGRSIIENPSKFYEPGLRWLYGFSKEWSGKTKIDLGFEYINTGSIKWLYILLQELSKREELSENTLVKWYYEQGDDDMCELGFILQSLVECHFSIIEVDEMNSKLYEDLMSGND